MDYGLSALFSPYHFRRRVRFANINYSDTDNTTATLDNATQESITEASWASMPYVHCGERMWPIFLAACVAFGSVMALGLAIGRALLSVWEHRNARSYKLVPGALPTGHGANERPSWMSTAKFVIGETISLSTTTGRTLAFLEFFLGMAVLFLYFSHVSRKTIAVESCVNWTERIDLQVEFICNAILLSIFMLRFIGAMDKVDFLLSIKSLVTYFTIPPSFLTLIFNHDWIGLRCLRACHLLFIPDYFRYSQLVKKATIRRLIYICTVIVTVTLVAAGIFHLLELTGDDWIGARVGQQDKTYWEWVYMSVVTLSTVGYGDLSPKSTLGQIFCIMFIVGALALFASSVPEIYGLISNFQQFTAPYKLGSGIQHVIVSGHITATTMQALIKDLSRPDRRQRSLDLVFVNSEEPSMEMKSLLKEVQTYVQYVQGSLLHAACLQNAKVNAAVAYLHVANRSSVDPYKDDSTTLLTIASIKSWNPYLRCVAEVLQNGTKSQFSSIPGFLMERGDTVICFQELELALTAQNCLAPGCATLLSNMIRASLSESLDIGEASQEVQDYVHGCYMEMYSGPFSPICYGMTFFQAAELCYSKLDVVLIGTFTPARTNASTPESNGRSGLLLCDGSVIISEDCIGIFLARSAIDVRRVSWYCQACHANLKDVGRCVPCKCKHGAKAKRSSVQARRNPYRSIWGQSREEVEADGAAPIKSLKPTKHSFGFEDMLMRKIRSDALTDSADFNSDSRLLRKKSVHAKTKIFLDISRNFYWCESRPFASILLDRSMALDYPFKNHIIVLVSSHPDDPIMDLRDFVVPMRSSRIPHNELKEIVLLGNPVYLEREWPQLRNLPLITVVDGDPLNRADLRAVSVKTAAMCVVLSAWTGKSIDPILDDKTAVLTTLNLKAMPFDHPDGKMAGSDFELPIVTALQHDHNVRMLSECAPSETEVTEAFLMEPYMCGQTVTISALDSLVCTSYFTPLAVAVVEHLLYGFQSPLMESYLAEGVGLMGGDEYSPDKLSDCNIRIRLIPVKDGPWIATGSFTESNLTYGVLFNTALQFSMICLGISRKLQGSVDKSTGKRIVLTNPPKRSFLRWDDHVYVLTK
ncbi:calcium-activated potassium channel slowpoke-like isoform X2 [Paramacrobiotus metropolitanus]|uniref:calcium-activated potassium channel slowpoke-like isoform X2 n=1 Tax=Paramacrobiotus metropolitanus TaxID=2943436 RepID=UPI0024456A70|nr:calcium-activated potassium channel slowpoke-like isoform X2 [Paramacrobiotus metropolitanus]